MDPPVAPADLRRKLFDQSDAPPAFWPSERAQYWICCTLHERPDLEQAFQDRVDRGEPIVVNQVPFRYQDVCLGLARWRSVAREERLGHNPFSGSSSSSGRPAPDRRSLEPSPLVNAAELAPPAREVVDTPSPEDLANEAPPLPPPAAQPVIEDKEVDPVSSQDDLLVCVDHKIGKWMVCHLKTGERVYLESFGVGTSWDLDMMDDTAMVFEIKPEGEGLAHLVDNEFGFRHMFCSRKGELYGDVLLVAVEGGRLVKQRVAYVALEAFRLHSIDIKPWGWRCNNYVAKLVR